MSARIPLLCVTVLSCGCWFLRAPDYQGPLARWMLVEATAAADDPSAPVQHLARRDFKEIAADVPTVTKVIPARLGTASVGPAHGQGEEIEVVVCGSTSDMIDLLSVDLRATVVAGRFLLNSDKSVAVITEDLATQLFGSSDAVGNSIRLGPHVLQVVGVVSYGERAWTRRLHPPLFVPQATFDTMEESLTLRSVSEVDQVWILTNDMFRVNEAKRKVQRILEKNHPGQSFEVQAGMDKHPKQ